MVGESKKNREKMALNEEIDFDKDITVFYENGIMNVRGPKGETKKKLEDRQVNISISDNKILLSSSSTNRRMKNIINTFKAHIKNLILGVKESFTYTLKICSGHFPMKVSVDKNNLIVQNFLGEKVPRVLEFDPHVKVTVSDDIITVEGINKELAGQTAASIEKLTVRTGYDTRIFQDGIYVTNKCGKELK